MHRNSFPLLPWLALAGLVLAVGCAPASRTESARLVVSLPSDSPSGDVTRVSVTLTAEDLAARATELVRSGEAWSGTFPDVPEGSARTFSAVAFDARGLKRFEGRAEDIPVTAGRELVVTFTLQPTGAAALDASLNRRPVLAGLTASPSRVDVGQSTTVSASVSDPDGDALTYQWSVTGCTGRIEDATSASVRFTPDARPAGDACGSCRLGFVATDARGAQARGSLGLCVGPPPSVNLAPHVVDLDMASPPYYPGNHLALIAHAWDPQGSALTFSWEANVGWFSIKPIHAPTSSSIHWVVPSCVPADLKVPPVRVIVRNALGQTGAGIFPISFDKVPVCHTRWAPTGSMTRTRQEHTATLLGSGRVLVTGGWDGTQALQSTELYDPATGTWTQTGAMNTPRYGHTATLLDGDRVLVTGGFSTQSHTSAELYDPLTGMWSYVASMDTPRHRHTATRLSWGGVLVTGGLNPIDQLSNVELYLPASNTWEYQGDMGAIRYQHTATLLPQDRVLVTGGKGTSSNTAEIFDPITGRFTSAGTLGRSRSRHTATMLSSGRVLIVGGDTGAGPTDHTELFDPATRTWTSAYSLSQPRAGHTATLLPDGTVLIVGGTNGGGPLASAELYNPPASRWEPASSPLTAREGHTAVPLGSGRVLVTGGTLGGAPSATAELYAQ